MNSKTLAILIAASASLSLATAANAQQSSQYEGTSKPPTDIIEASPDAPPPPPIPKPSAAVVAPVQVVVAPQPTSYGPVPAPTASDDTIISNIEPPRENGVALTKRAPVDDPDGDIVHVRPARPGELLEGATIRVKLLDRLSSTDSEKGEQFRGEVAYDVLQDGRVLIPRGSSIEGRVTAVSAGHFGGHGSIHLRPDVVVLPDGSRYQLHAETTGAMGTKARIGAEGSINPGSRAKKVGIEYGAVVGTGAITGAVLGGPVGALTGSLVGAGIVTTHVLVNHPQATLEPGSILLFSLTEPMNLTPATN
jgi:hypothetical protein